MKYLLFLIIILIPVELEQRAITREMTLRHHLNNVKNRVGVKKARVAVVRKLFEIIYKVWRRNGLIMKNL